MTDTRPAPAPPADANAAPVGPVHSRIGIAAVAVGIVGFVAAVMPVVSFAAVVPCVGAIVLGIIALTRRDRRRTLGVVGLIVGIASLVLAVAVSIATVHWNLGNRWISLERDSPAATARHAGPQKPGEEYGTFTPIRDRGETDATIRLPRDVWGGLVSVRSQGGIRIDALDADGRVAETVVRSDGAVTGSAAWGVFGQYASPTRLRITASAPWTVDLDPVASATRVRGHQEGGGRQVLILTGTDTASVTTRDGRPVSLKTQTLGPTGHAVLVEVRGDGHWTVDGR